MAVPEIRFRALRVDDLEVLVGWFAEADVARWWNQPATLDAVTEKYLPRIEGRDPTRMWVVEIDEVSAGLIQDYLHADDPEYDECVGVPDAIGIDYLLGGVHRGRGLASLVLSEFAALVLELHPAMECCVATPARSNRASWRALERAGFVRRGECDPPDEPPAYVYSVARAG